MWNIYYIYKIKLWIYIYLYYFTISRCHLIIPNLDIALKILIVFRYYSVFREYGVFEFRDFVPFLLPLSMSLLAPKILVAFKMWLIMLLISSAVFGMIGFNAAHHHPDIFHDGDIYRLRINCVPLSLNY